LIYAYIEHYNGRNVPDVFNLGKRIIWNDLTPYGDTYNIFDSDIFRD